MRLKNLLLAITAVATISMIGCKPKDADIKAAVEAALKADASAAGTTVEVKDGVATISGVCKDDACKAACEKMVAGVKNVKSVVNNCTVKPVEVPTSVNVTVTDPKVDAAIKAVIKDMPGVTVAYEGGKAVFSGTVSAKQKQTIAQACMAAKIAPDLSKVTVK